MTLRAVLGLLAALVAGGLAQEPSFAGRWQGGGLTVVVEPAGDAWRGEIRRGEERFAFRARREGGALVGSFAHGADQFPLRAEFSGGELVLATGGATYRLARAPAGGAGPGQAFRLHRVLDERGFRDEAGRPLEAFRLLVPEGWRFEGGVTWELEHTQPVYLTRMQLMVPARVAFRVSSPDGTCALQVYPEVHFADLSRAPAGPMFPPGSDYMGATSWPVVTPAEFVRGFVLPRQRGLDPARVREVEARDLPELAARFAGEVEGINRAAGLTGGVRAVHRACLVTVDHDQGGEAREAFLCDLLALEMPGITLWWPRFSASARAPRERFAALHGVFLTVLASLEANPRWLLRYLKVTDQAWAGIQETDAVLRRLDQEIASHRAGTNQRIHRDMYPRLAPWAVHVDPQGRKRYLATDQDHQIDAEGNVRSGLDLPRDEPGWQPLRATGD